MNNSFLCSSSVSFLGVIFQIRTVQVDKLGVSCGMPSCSAHVVELSDKKLCLCRAGCSAP